MRRVSEAMVFTVLATAVHAAAIAGLAGGSGLPGGTGDGGDAIVTIAAAPQSVMRRVEDWDRSPDVAAADEARAAPEPAAAPTLSAEPPPPERMADPSALSAAARSDESLPDLPEALRAPQAPVALPAIESRRVEPHSPRPDMRAPRETVEDEADARGADVTPAPRRPELALDPDKAPTPPPPPQSARRASGAGSGAARGSSAPAETAAARTADSATLVADWSARIRARIESRKAAPGGRWEPGGALLRITVSSGGDLLQLGLLRSSGDKRLDDAAVAAVRRAGPFPEAPKDLPYETVTFDLPVLFTR